MPCIPAGGLSNSNHSAQPSDWGRNFKTHENEFTINMTNGEVLGTEKRSETHIYGNGSDSGFKIYSNTILH